jgi:hypothetical protein
MLLFDLSPASAELWVGSHNWTARALTGVNIEASIRARVETGSRLYIESAGFLESIRSQCERFDPNAVDYYKWLQGRSAEEEIWVLELRGQASLLDTSRKLTVFGRTDADYQNLKQVDQNVVVSILDDSSGREVLYEASINDTGRLGAAGVDFDTRIYAAHDGSPLPQLKGPAKPPTEVLRSSTSWATVTLVDQLYGESFEVPPPQRWLPAGSNDSETMMPPELRRWFTDPNRPLVQRPLPRSAFERRELLPDDKERRIPKLIRRKVVRAKRRSGEPFTLLKKGQRKAPKEE